MTWEAETILHIIEILKKHLAHAEQEPSKITLNQVKQALHDSEYWRDEYLYEFVGSYNFVIRER